MQVSVRFFTSLREIIGKKEQIFEFPERKTVTVNRILKRLSEQYGKSFIEYVFDDRTNEVKGFLQLLVNGRSLTSTGGLDVELADGDVLALIPPVGGG